MFVFLIVMFVGVILWQMDAMVSFADAIYDGLNSAFGFFPVVAIVGALAYLGGRSR